MRPIIVHSHTRPLTQVAYNQEGDLLFTAARDKSPNVFFSSNGDHLGSFDGHNGAVMSLSVAADSQYLLTAAADQSVKKWSVQTGECVNTIDFKTSAKSVEYSYGDKMFLVQTVERAAFPQILHLIDSSTNKEVKSFQINGPRVSVARFGHLNKTIFMGHEDGSVSSWDVGTGNQTNIVKIHSLAVTDIQLYTDRTYFITSSKDESSKVVDCKTLKVHKTYTSDRPLNSAALSPTHDIVILGGGQEARDVTTTSARAGRFEICLYHRIYAEELGRIKGHFGPVNTLAFAPDGKSFTSGGEDGYVRIHHFDSDYFEYDYET